MAVKLKFVICEFHSSLQPILRLSCWYGFIPVEGINHSTPEKLRFNLKSGYGVYCITSALCIAVTLCLSVCTVIKYDMSCLSVVQFAFTMQIVLVMFLTLRLTRNWPALVNAAWNTERVLYSIRKTRNIPKKCTILSYTIMILALVEYALNCLYKYKQANCSESSDISTSLKKFSRNKVLDVFEFIPYNVWLAIYAEVLCVQKTFLWSFGDVLVSCISVYFISYFNDLGKAISSKKSKDWRQLRECYSRLVVLLTQINSQLGGFILVSAISNLFFICIQFFSSINQTLHEKNQKYCQSDASEMLERNLKIYHMIYYIFSFMFLILRASMVLFLSAEVHTAATTAVENLYEVSSFEYDIEVQRFQLQVRCTKVGLSGIFFHVERTMIMKVIATIITYELVMLQFNHNK